MENQPLKIKPMYWIYLVIFTLIVFVPTLVGQSFGGLTLVQTQEYGILFLGIIAFMIFLWQERQYKKNRQERSSMLKQVSRMSKDLQHSYSYIGEINRKLDILENITQGFPETYQLTEKRKMEIYDSIMGSIQMFSKSNAFVLRFVNNRNNETLKEIKSSKKESAKFFQDKCGQPGQFVEDNESVIVSSPNSIDNVYSCIIIKKKGSARVIDDPVIMKTIAAQALFLFMLIQYKRIPSQEGAA